MYVIVLTNHAYDVVGPFSLEEAHQFLQKNGWKKVGSDTVTFERKLVFTIQGGPVEEVQGAKIVFVKSPHGWTNPIAARIA